MEFSEVAIRSRAFWYKIVDFLQQNWALVDERPGGGGCTAFFIHDGGGVFDRIEFASAQAAADALGRNGFAPYDEADDQTRDLIAPPEGGFHEAEHPNGAIYSSGRFWR